MLFYRSIPPTKNASIFNQKRLVKKIDKKNKKERKKMIKMISKLAEKYAKATSNACILIGIFHQPKMPASLIKKD